MTVAVQGNKPIKASMATDFPEPDSPTIAKISFSLIVRLKLSTARKTPPLVLKSTFKFLIDSSAINFSLVLDPVHHEDHRPLD